MAANARVFGRHQTVAVSGPARACVAVISTAHGRIPSREEIEALDDRDLANHFLCLRRGLLVRGVDPDFVSLSPGGEFQLIDGDKDFESIEITGSLLERVDDRWDRRSTPYLAAAEPDWDAAYERLRVALVLLAGMFVFAALMVGILL